MSATRDGTSEIFLAARREMKLTFLILIVIADSQLFSQMFGGKAFEDWIGEISLGKEVSKAFVSPLRSRLR